MQTPKHGTSPSGQTHAPLRQSFRLPIGQSLLVQPASTGMQRVPHFFVIPALHFFFLFFLCFLASVASRLPRAPSSVPTETPKAVRRDSAADRARAT